MTILVTSFTTLASELSSMSVAGVTRQYSEPPLSLNTADLPASWPMLPSGDDEELVFCGHGGFPNRNLDMVYAFEAVGQSRQIENYAGTLTLIDAVETALCGLPNNFSKRGIAWTLNISIVAVAEITYWAVVASVAA